MSACTGSLVSTTHIALLEAGDFCKFNSLDGRPVDAMLIRTDKQKVAERLTVSYFLEARVRVTIMHCQETSHCFSGIPYFIASLVSLY